MGVGEQIGVQAWEWVQMGAVKLKQPGLEKLLK